MSLSADWAGRLVISYREMPPAWLLERLRACRREIADLLPRDERQKLSARERQQRWNGTKNQRSHQ